MRFSKFVSLKGIFFGLRFKEYFSALSLQGSLTAANYKMNEMRRWTVKSKAQLPDLSPQFFVCPNLLLLFPKPVLPVSLDRHGRSSHCLSLLCYGFHWPKQPVGRSSHLQQLWPRLLFTLFLEHTIPQCGRVLGLDHCQSLLSTRKDFQSQYH